MTGWMRGERHVGRVGDGENINRTRNAAAAGDNKKKRVLNLVKRFYKLDAPSFKKEG